MSKSKSSLDKSGSRASEKSMPYGNDHEALLVTAYRELPGLLAVSLHSIEHLNVALRKRANERREEIKKKLYSSDISEDQKQLWRAVPDLQFASSGIAPPVIELGLTLYRWVDARGERKKVAEALCVVDFYADVEIPRWSTGHLRLYSGSNTEQISSPSEGVSGVMLGREKHRVLGIVLTNQVTLGQAIREIERVGDAGMVDSVLNSYGHGERPFILCVTDREELFHLLRDKVDVMLVEEDGDIAYDFGFLESKVGRP